MTKRLLLAALVLSGFAYADGGCVHDMALQQRATGLAVIPGAQVRVCTDTACNSLATIYSDSTLGTSMTNPATADTKGNYSFCAASGTYTVKVTNPADGTFYLQTNVSAVGPSATTDTPQDKAFYNAVTDCGVATTLGTDVGAALNACLLAHPSRKIVLPKIQAIAACDYTSSVPLTLRGFYQRLVGERIDVKICFSTGVTGIVLDNNLASKPEISYLTISGPDAWTPSNIATYILTGTTDGIQVFADHAVMTNLVINGFARHGININSTAFGGNGSHYLIENVTVQNIRGDGFHVEGNNVSVGTMINADARTVQGWCFYEKDTLGNTYVTPHTTQCHTENTTPASTVNVATTSLAGHIATVTTSTAHGAVVGSWVKFTGTTHIGGFNNWFQVLTVPDTTTMTVWTYGSNTVTVAADTGTVGVTPGGEIWRIASFTGGPYYNGNNAGTTTYTGAYSEAGQPRSNLTHLGIFLGGQDGSSFDYSNGGPNYVDIDTMRIPSGYNFVQPRDSGATINFKAGATAAATFTHKFLDFNAAQMWAVVASQNGYTISDKNSRLRLNFDAGGVTDINGVGAQPIGFNRNGNSGTAGIAIYDGAASPAQVASIDQTGKGTFKSDVINGASGELWTRGQITELLTLSTSGATTDTSANLLPANSIIEAVVARVTTTITTATDWAIGDGTTTARFASANATLIAGTTTVGLNHQKGGVATDAAGPVQVSAAKIRVTTTGTPGAGAIRITVFYRTFTPPTS